MLTLIKCIIELKKRITRLQYSARTNVRHSEMKNSSLNSRLHAICIKSRLHPPTVIHIQLGPVLAIVK